MFATTTLFAVLLAYPVRSAGQLFRRQDLSGVPSCGQTCLISAASNSKIIGSCSISDVPCLCKNQNFQNSVQNCALSACSTQDQIKMLTWATKTCPTTAGATTSPPQAPASTAAGPAGVAGLPSCGQKCLASTASKSGIVGSCSLTDIACLCKNQNFIGMVTTCVASQCSLNDKLTMLTWSGTTCSSGSVSTGQTSSAAEPPAKNETPSTVTPSAALPPAKKEPPSQTTQNATSNTGYIKNHKTEPKSENNGPAPNGTQQLPNTSQWNTSGTQQLPNNSQWNTSGTQLPNTSQWNTSGPQQLLNTSQWNTSQNYSTYVSTNSTTVNSGVMQGSINQLTNTSQTIATQNGSANATQSSPSGTMPAASQNVTTPFMNPNSTNNITMPIIGSCPGPANTTSSASPQNTDSLPAQYPPDVPSASSGPLAGSSMWIITAMLIPATLL